MFGDGDGLDSILHRKQPSAIALFLHDPLICLASALYRLTRCKRPPSKLHRLPLPNPASIRIVCMADTHNAVLDKALVPDGDILIHAGDLSHSGTPAELQNTLDWIGELPHPHKIVIPGNHDTSFAGSPVFDEFVLRENVTILRDEACDVTVHSITLKVYGSPWTPKHGSGVFQYCRSDAGARWSNIPSDTDILVTHGPPIFHLDLHGLGCPALLDALWVVRPRLHVFGHIHGGRGTDIAHWDDSQRLYESLMRRKLGICALLKLLLATGRDLLFAKVRSENIDGSTVLVNAAIRGGIRDDDIRDVVVVDLPERSA